MYARTISSYLIPGKADETIRIFRDRVVPVARGQPGYVSTAIYTPPGRSAGPTRRDRRPTTRLLVASPGADAS